ncbi:MAG: hypothetical protein CMJ83_05620 [Planctomycetes bacterium]|nr:hypothetical protein [Planctomycetota bacterium]
MKQHPAWGVDVTSVAVRGVQIAVGAEGKPRITGWDIVDYTEEVEDTSSLARFATMGRGIYHFMSRHQTRRSRVWVSLRSETAFNRTVQVPPVNDEGLDKILEYEAQQQVPHALEEIYWDRRVIAIREDGEVLATLFAVRKNIVEDRLRKFEKARLPVDGIQLRALGLQNFCAYERLLEEGTVVIDVDYGGLQVLIHHGDQTWFRVLPVGGVDLVARLRETFDCNHRTAVRMATGQANIPDQELFEACRREVAADIVDEAVRTVRYYMAARPDMRPSGVVLFESHGCVPPLNAALKRAMDMPVFRPKGFRSIAVDPDAVTVGIQEHFAPLAKAAGLALQGVGKAEVEVRLFPDGLERNLDSRKTGYVVAAVCVFITLLVAGFRRGLAADEVLEARLAYQATTESGKWRAGAEQKSNPMGPLKQLDALREPTVGRTGPMPFIAHVYNVLDQWEGSVRPQIVSIQYAASIPTEAKVVIAFPVGVRSGNAPLDPTKEIDRFATSLVDLKNVTAAKGGASWTSGRITHENIIRTNTRRLRYRYTHRRYTMTLGGGS